jgi:hypothetical protein
VNTTSHDPVEFERLAGRALDSMPPLDDGGEAKGGSSAGDRRDTIRDESWKPWSPPSAP